MDTVEQNNVAAQIDNEPEQTNASSSYTSILNSAIDSTKLKKTKSHTSRFFYTVGDYHFLFEKSLKVENLPTTSINKVPHAPDWCIGIISIRGIIMPVVDMQIVLKNELEYKAGNDDPNIHFLMIEHPQHAPIVLQIDQLPETVTLKKFTSGSAKKLPNWVKKTWTNSDKKLYEVDHNKLFNQLKPVKSN